MQGHLRSKAVVGKARLAAYAAACTSMAVGAQEANAAITYTSENTLLNDNTLDGFAIAVDLLFGSTPHHLALGHGIGTTNAATGYAIMDSNALGVPGVDGVAGFVAGPYNYVTKVAYNAAISGLAFLTAAQVGAGATMAFNTGYGNDQFLAPGVGFIGVKFNVNQFGWIRVNMNGAPLNSFTVVDFAYAGPGEPIRAGEVPEPSSLAALALGAIGIAGWRKSRRKQPS
jgi:hypothetical protein